MIGMPDPIYEERVVAFVRLAEGADRPEETALIAYVRERLAGFKVPKVVHFVDDLPRTGAGKVAKPELRRQLAGETA